MALSIILTSARLTEPDRASLLANLRAIDPTVGVRIMDAQTYTLQKDSDWLAPHIAQAQTIINAAPAASPQLIAQAVIDRWPIETRAFALALIDQLNVLRAALPSPLPAITPAQALAAIRAKAGTL